LADQTTGWGWPEELDALTAAPDNHRVLLENPRVRVPETVVRAGKSMVSSSTAANAPLRPSDVRW